MTPEAYFAEMKINLTIGLHCAGPGKTWWARASKTIDGISVGIDEYHDNLNGLLTALELAWKDKTEILPKEFSVPKQLVYAEYRDVSPGGITPVDDIPF